MERLLNVQGAPEAGRVKVTIAIGESSRANESAARF